MKLRTSFFATAFSPVTPISYRVLLIPVKSLTHNLPSFREFVQHQVISERSFACAI
jgi:hypothetical protein